jgi:hypothetical protein
MKAKPTLAQWFERDAHPHIFNIKAHGCRRRLFRLSQADWTQHNKRDASLEGRLVLYNFHIRQI